MRYWDDIDLPDEDELAEDSADLLPIDATSQPECKDDEEQLRISSQKGKSTFFCALLYADVVAFPTAGWQQPRLAAV